VASIEVSGYSHACKQSSDLIRYVNSASMIGLCNGDTLAVIKVDIFYMCLFETKCNDQYRGIFHSLQSTQTK
jgi:hypothetical protein